MDIISVLYVIFLNLLFPLFVLSEYFEFSVMHILPSDFSPAVLRLSALRAGHSRFQFSWHCAVLFQRDRGGMNGSTWRLWKGGEMHGMIRWWGGI